MTPRGRSRPSELADLLRRGLKGDDISYGRFLEEASRRLRRFCASRLPPGLPGFDAEDLVQEILMAIHAKRHTWRRDEPIEPWIFAIARYKAIDAFRRHGRRLEVDLSAHFDALVTEPDESGVVAEDVKRSVGELGGRVFDVVTSISIEGRSIEETAQRLDISQGAVRIAFHRGLKALSERRERSE